MRQTQMHIYDVGGRRAWYHDGCEPLGAVRIDAVAERSASSASTKSRTVKNKARTPRGKRGGDTDAVD